MGIPDHETVVYLPTVYDDWPQQVLGKRALGDALAVDSPDDCAAVRAAIEATGVRCAGWSVPRGTGDADAEGYLHGLYAATFDEFILNYEQWRSGEGQDEEYWVHPQNPAYVHLFMGGFNRALRDQGRVGKVRLGITFVTNSMLVSAGDDVERAWLSYVDYVALEAYYPGDRNLDPANSLRIWREHCINDLGIEPVPAVAILAGGDVPADAVKFGVYGDVQVWTFITGTGFTWPGNG